ncbi:hypothetical protein EV421DRAFT_1741128 [Armillaria borealis]|uniref:Uncharacterized protein n=1 Tax=Armillaria borealis TaxID=47425 RepID=A0AA39J0Y3_9AGAR|nr:hypothetical protein EV421DRAFT_1741128 [Armillaria borealis]
MATNHKDLCISEIYKTLAISKQPKKRDSSTHTELYTISQDSLIPVQSTLKCSSDQFSTLEPRVVCPRLASSISSPQGLGGSVDDNMSELTPVESDRESTMQNIIVSGGVRGRARTVQSPSAKAGQVKGAATLQRLRVEKQDLMAQLDRARGEINILQKQNEQLILEQWLASILQNKTVPRHYFRGRIPTPALISYLWWML